MDEKKQKEGFTLKYFHAKAEKLLQQLRYDSKLQSKSFPIEEIFVDKY